MNATATRNELSIIASAIDSAARRAASEPVNIRFLEQLEETLALHLERVREILQEMRDGIQPK